MNVEKLKKRQDFVRLSARKDGVKMPAFIILLEKNDTDTIRFGVTASKRIGNAVKRARAKRRMRAVFDKVVRLNPAFNYSSGFDVNLIARGYVLDRKFDRMVKEFQKALDEKK